MGEKEELKKGLTVKSLIVASTIIVLINAFFGSRGFMRTMYVETSALNIDSFVLFGIVTTLTFIIALINLKKNIFSLQEMAIMTTMIWAGGFLATSNPYFPAYALVNITMMTSYWALAWNVRNPTLVQYTPKIWIPTDPDVVKQVLKGGAVVNWGAWAPTLGWAVLVLGSAALFMTFLALLLRQLYVNIEYMPFPIAGIQGDLIKLTQQTESKKASGFSPFLFKAKWFWIGFIVEFLLALSFVIDMTRPNIGKLTTELWPGAGFHPNNYGLDYTAARILPYWVVLGFRLYPWEIAFAYLLPLEILSGFAFGWVSLMLIPIIAFTAVGLIPPYPGGYSSWAVYKMTAYQLPSINNYTPSVGFGATIAVALFPLWLNRTHVINVIKGIYKKQPELDAQSPIKYQHIWLGFIVGGILLLVALLISEAPVLQTLLWLPIFIVTIIGFARILGDSGGHFGLIDYSINCAPA